MNLRITHYEFDALTLNRHWKCLYKISLPACTVVITIINTSVNFNMIPSKIHGSLRARFTFCIKNFSFQQQPASMRAGARLFRIFVVASVSLQPVQPFHPIFSASLYDGVFPVTLCTKAPAYHDITFMEFSEIKRTPCWNGSYVRNALRFTELTTYGTYKTVLTLKRAKYRSIQ